MDTPIKKSFWITFRISINEGAGAIEGDLVAQSVKLDAQFLQEVKQGIAAELIRRNGGVLIPNMNEPVMLAVIPLED